MAMTAAERQAKRRAKLKGRYGQNFSTVLSGEARLALERLARYHGETKTEIVSALILAFDREQIKGLINDKAKMDEYVGRS